MMKALLKIAIIGCIAFVSSTTVFSQDWTKAQKEVWQVVENSWSKWKAGDINGFGENIHEKYQGWNNNWPLPLNKEQVLTLFNESKEKSKIDKLTLNPARIVVTDNAAVVDYYFILQQTTTEGQHKATTEFQGKNVEFYVKEGRKWLLLGDMTVFNEVQQGSE